MTHPGMGVMIGVLSGSTIDTRTAIAKMIGREIEDARLVEDEYPDGLYLRFTDGSSARLYDNGQSCCEIRYPTCDDNLDVHKGAKILNVEVRDGPENHDDHGNAGEEQFLLVTTSAGVITVVNHNEHNGYYGGFLLTADLKEVPA